MAAKMYWLHALTPLHVGTGRGVGFIDLPVAREKATGWPVVPGSGIKGVLADRHGATDDKRKTDPKLAAAFGRADDKLANSGALIFTDARMVCLPVRSLYGTFAWVTSPLALRRLARDLENVKPAELPTALPEVADANQIKLPESGSDLGSPT
ncbi:partial CRISPR system Cms endoribonuclease Csm3, partial [Gammaproteobacteria bacterium]